MEARYTESAEPDGRRTPARGRGSLRLALFALAMLVRLLPGHRYVTPDEPIWVLRSVRLADALASGRWTEIPQTGHPGLTTMALGAAAVRVMALARPQATAEHLAWLRQLAWLAPENSAAFPHLVYFLPMARLFVALATAMGTVAAYDLARRPLGEPAARKLALLLALDPFLAGHGGLLHTDALQATCILLAVLAAQRESLPALAASALGLAMAGLTKLLGLLAAPGVALTILLRGRGTWLRRAERVAALTALTVALLGLLYPPAWADPGAALRTLWGAITYHEGIGLRETFFAGRMVTDPGPLFYPAVLLFRLTPPVLIGLAVSWRGGRRRVAFALPALTYLLALTAAAKKFDRYALTVLPLLTALAVAAWARLPRRWWRWSVAALLLSWAVVAPLPLLYADPLVGGPWIARHIVPLGWGEGAGLAAAQAARLLPQPERRLLLTAHVPGAAPFFPGETRPLTPDLLPCADAVIADETPAGFVPLATVRLAGMPLTTLARATATYAEADVAPGPMPGVPPRAVAPRTDTLALHRWLEARLTGKPFLRLRAPTCYPLTEAQLDLLLREPAVTCVPLDTVWARCTPHSALPAVAPYRARFGELALLSVALPREAQAPRPLTVALRWQPLAPIGEMSLNLALTGADGLPYAEGGTPLVDRRGWPASAWAVGQPADAESYIPLPLTLPPGTYTVTLGLFDAADRGMGVWAGDGTFGGTRRTLGRVQVAPPPFPATDVGLPPAPPLAAEGIRLVGASPPPADHWAGDRLPFHLGWERTGDAGPPPTSLHWSLRCGADEVDGGTLPLAPADAADWPPGHRYVVPYAPRTNPRLPDGACTLWVRTGHAPAVSLGSVTVHRRPRRFSLPHPPRLPLDVRAADFARLVGVDVTPLSPTAGMTWTVQLYWRAEAPAPLDYTAFVHLVGQDEHIWAQSDHPPAGGVAPTTSWLAGQVVVDEHILTLPQALPPGTYHLYTGLYDGGSGGRVPLYDAEGHRLTGDRARLLTLQVESP